MLTISEMLQGGGAVALAVGALYAATVTTVVLTALLAPTPARRRDAQEVLKILLRRRSGHW